MSFLTVKTRRKSAPFRVKHLLYPGHYSQAFAFSGILYPLSCPPCLRLGYHVCTWDWWGLPRSA